MTDTQRRQRPSVPGLEPAPPAAGGLYQPFQDLDAPEPADAPQTAVRAEARPAMREDTPRDAAARRAAQIREHLGENGFESTTDEFHIDARCIPDGWTYEWKTETVMNAENPAYKVQIATGGWTEVPLSRHPEMMPAGWRGKTIDRKGMRLYERPAEITEEVKAIERRKAADQMGDKEKSLRGSEQGHFGRETPDGTPLVKIQKSYEPMAIPD